MCLCFCSAVKLTFVLDFCVKKCEYFASSSNLSIKFLHTSSGSELLNISTGLEYTS